MMQDKRNLSYQFEQIDARKQSNKRYYAQNPIVYNSYQHILENQYNRDKMYEHQHIEI